MGQAVTTDAGLATIYKTWYTGDKLANLLWRNSPALRMIQKERVGGKEYAFAMLYGRGGATSGDYVKAVANSASSSKNAEMKVQPGKIFTVFNINQLERLASKDQKGAYINSAVNRMFAATEGSRKTLAACFYGSGYGEVGQLQAVVNAGDSTLTLNYDAILKLDVGSKFEVSSTTSASSALVAGGPFTVTAINGSTVTFSPVAPAGGFVNAGWVELEGGRDAGGAPNMPTGLSAWLPSFLNRGAAGGQDLIDWNAYIATAFYGTTRSVATDRLAGSFYLRNSGANEKYSSAISNGVKLARRNGGVPNLIVMNDDDYKTVVDELEATTTYWQSINSGDKKGKNEVVKGISDMSFAFSTSWVQYVIDDPYCPKGVAYILDKDVVKWIGLSNADRFMGDSVSGNEPGKDSVDSVGEPSFNYDLMIDDYLDVRPASDTTEGPGARVSISIYGNFVVQNPASCTVVKF